MRLCVLLNLIMHLFESPSVVVEFYSALGQTGMLAISRIAIFVPLFDVP